MTLDVIFLAWNRLAFTREAFAALYAGTNWTDVRRLVIYDDGSTDGTAELLDEFAEDLGLHCGGLVIETVRTKLRSPVAVMNDYLRRNPAELFAKIDSDTVVPPGWLIECLNVLRRQPEVDLLGIEAIYPSDMAAAVRNASPTGHIGGIGLMRTAVFDVYGLPQAAGRLGFSDWQVKHPDVRKAWLNPALPVILLDRLPFEPWASLSRQYEAAGWQRPWKRYTEADRKLWEWWSK
jgi:glycosyltransferase involved in cell wall biosynthesis